jgi:ribonucleotide reductase beta subunit family protein with ferritin-like domain
MKLIDKLLRLPLADEVQCLLERIDKMENMHDTSYTPIRDLLNEGGFSIYEYAILNRALNKVVRRNAYARAMHVVVTNRLPMQGEKF